MALTDKKGLAAAILAKVPKTTVIEEDDVTDNDVALESAMEEFMAALQAQDVEAAVSAYKTMRELS